MLFFLSSAFGLPCGFVPPPAAVAPRRTVLSSSNTRQTREVFEEVKTHETEHFAIKWGEDFEPVPAHLEAMAADLEEIWQRQVGELGWPAPVGSDAFRVNVYLASTADHIPQIDFSGGYVWYDKEGYPYIALSPDSLEGYDPAWAWINTPGLLAHEFNHVLQLGNSAFLDGGRYGYFFHEATANWAEPHTWDTGADKWWGRYLLNPHIDVDMWARHTDEEHVAGRQYDTALFLYYLTEQRGLGPEFIRNVWMNATIDDDPLDVLDARLEGGLDKAFVDFAVQYALEDHAFAETYAEGADLFASWDYSDNRITAYIPDSGSGGWRRPPSDLRPQGHGWNRLMWTATDADTVRMRFEPDVYGLFHTQSAFTPVLTLETDSGIEYVDTDTPVSVEPGDVLRLIVVSTVANAEPDEVFGYRYALDIAPFAVDEPDDSAEASVACGCRAAPTSTWVSGLRRRR